MSDDPLPSPSRRDDLAIRPARMSDAEALTAIALLPGFRAGTLRLPFQSLDETRGILDGLGDTKILLVAERDGVVLGSAGWTRSAGRRSHAATIGMGVHDDHVGQGIGAALLGTLCDAADRWYAIRRLDLTVFVDNAAAIRLYRGFGFEEEGRLRDYAVADGRYVDAFAMARIRAFG